MINLQPEQLRAIKAYVHSSTDSLTQDEKIIERVINPSMFTYNLNVHLRSGRSLANEVNDFAQRLDKAFTDVSTDDDLTLYRTFNYKEMEANIIDETYKDYGYMSTTSDTEVANSFFYRIESNYFPAFLELIFPKGCSILPLENIVDFDNHTYEAESLVKRNSEWEVISNKIVPAKPTMNLATWHFCKQPKEIRLLKLRFNQYF